MPIITANATKSRRALESIPAEALPELSLKGGQRIRFGRWHECVHGAAVIARSSASLSSETMMCVAANLGSPPSSSWTGVSSPPSPGRVPLISNSRPRGRELHKPHWRRTPARGRSSAERFGGEPNLQQARGSSLRGPSRLLSGSSPRWVMVFDRSGTVQRGSPGMRASSSHGEVQQREELPEGVLVLGARRRADVVHVDVDVVVGRERGPLP